MAVINVNGSLQSNLKSIQAFNDNQIKFFRDEESSYYQRILQIINFIKNTEIDKLNKTFHKYSDTIKDFKELFESLAFSKEYDRASSKKSNFYETIKKVIEIIQEDELNMQKEISTLENTLDEYNKKFKSMEDTLKDYQKISIEHNNNFQDINNKFTDILKKSQNLETSFKEHNKIFETKQYWQKKSSKHLWTSLISFVLFLSLIITLIYRVNEKIEANKQADIQSSPMSIVVAKNTSTFVKSPQLIDYEKTLEKHMIIRYIQYLFLLSLILWIARILLKITFSNLHLREEAHEKETMIMTYLALINEGGGLENNDRQLILEAIFRPSTNGLIKDETNITLIDIIKGIKK